MGLVFTNFQADKYFILLLIIIKTSHIKTGCLVYALKLGYINNQLDFLARVVLHVGIALILTPLLDYHIGA